MKAVFSVCILLASLGLFAQIGDGPVVKTHLDQADIDAGAVSFDYLMEHGELLFVAKFNTYDGQGRPATTGGGAPREAGSAPRFLRTSAPDANSCAGCHNDPFIGAAGDIVANVFVLAQTLDPVTESVSPEFSNNRNTVGMHGAGPIETLAIEMSAQLTAIRDAAISEASAAGASMTKTLMANGVYFGTITANADGSLDTSGVEGVDADLIIKPFHQKGAVISLREFTNNAMNHHHGIQTTERFGLGVDADQDGMADEMTVGDVTATSLWQAALGTPGQVIPNDSTVARAIIRGERTFTATGCADCHVPAMTLASRHFVEPNPNNPSGNAQVGDFATYSFDMTEYGFKPRLEKAPNGGAIIRAYTDLKRHNLCDDEINHYCNELVPQGGRDVDEFLTRKLWDVGNTAPYGHVGDVTTITEAIHYHGGDARASRDAFFELSDHEQAEVVEFLKSLQILPEGTESLVVDENYATKNKKRVKAEVEAQRTPLKPKGD